MHSYVSKIGQHWSRHCLVVYSGSNRYLNNVAILSTGNIWTTKFRSKSTYFQSQMLICNWIRIGKMVNIFFLAFGLEVLEPLRTGSLRQWIKGTCINRERDPEGRNGFQQIFTSTNGNCNVSFLTKHGIFSYVHKIPWIQPTKLLRNWIPLRGCIYVGISVYSIVQYHSYNFLLILILVFPGCR